MGRRGGQPAGLAAARRIDEEIAAGQMALKPVFDRLTALLGQVAGILLLATAQAEPERQRLHLIAMREHCDFARDALQALPVSARQSAGFRAADGALPILGGLLHRLEERYAVATAGGIELEDLLARLAEVRRILLAGSAPQLGLGLVDISGACCAGVH